MTGDEDDPLIRVYNQVLRFVARDLKDIIEVAEKVGSKSMTKDSVLGNNISKQGGDLDGFQVMGHVIWEEVASAIINDIGDTVFAAGRPNDLRKVSPWVYKGGRG